MDEKEVKPRRKNNALTQAQAATLRAWLVARREESAKEKAFPLALQAATALGFNVTESNILFHKRSLGITKPKPAPVVEGCRCRELAELMIGWFGVDSETTATLRKFLGRKAVPVAPELPLATSPLRFEAAG